MFKDVVLTIYKKKLAALKKLRNFFDNLHMYFAKNKIKINIFSGL